MQFTISLKTIFSGCFEPLKKEQISNFNEIWLKKCENLFWVVNFSFIWWATLLNNSSYEPHGTYVSGFTFLLQQEGPKKPQSFFSLLSQGWNSLPGACSDLDLDLGRGISSLLRFLHHRLHCTALHCIAMHSALSKFSQ